MIRPSIALAAALLIALQLPARAGYASIAFPGKDPGVPRAEAAPGRLTLENDALGLSWVRAGDRLVPGPVTDKLAGVSFPAPEELFSLVYRDGRVLAASRLHLAGEPIVEAVAAEPAASRAADRVPGRRLKAVLESREGDLRVTWTALLREGANYVRQQVAIAPQHGDADLAQVVLVDHYLPRADLVGQVAGSPIVADTLFEGFEHPMSAALVQAGAGGEVRRAPVPADKGEAECEDDPLPLVPSPLREGFGRHHAVAWLERALPIREGQSFDCSAVTGVAPAGQLRRAFLFYVERERAHPYRTFLHYNSWYDIGYFTPFNEADCLGVIEAFSTELARKRGVQMDSFLFDDGWDDPKKGGQWVFHDGFPNGFTPLKAATAKIGAAPGIWLSPWGGYGGPRTNRVQSGRAAGYEVAGEGYDTLFALSGPKYYESFHRACTTLVTRYGINQFKLDGAGNIDRVVPGSAFGSDFEAAIALIGDLRAIRPDLYINLTTGTWPSPFWLPICDSIWRGGWDHSFKGVGSARQRWITYRDADTHARIVVGGPLYPLNALMLHGVLYARKAHKLDTDPEGDFRSEVRSFFGSGTQLQELYVSHDLLSTTNWDDLAASAKWSRENAGTLVDTHWIGGDPGKLEVYGWAAWSPAKGLITLRNPSDEEQSFTLDLGRALELPAGAPAVFTLASAYPQPLPKEVPAEAEAGKPLTFPLKPFQVLVLEARPGS